MISKRWGEKKGLLFITPLRVEMDYNRWRWIPIRSSFGKYNFQDGGEIERRTSEKAFVEAHGGFEAWRLWNWRHVVDGDGDAEDEKWHPPSISWVAHQLLLVSPSPPCSTQRPQIAAEKKQKILVEEIISAKLEIITVQRLMMRNFCSHVQSFTCEV